MGKWTKAEPSSLSFKDRSFSKAAAGQLLETKSGRASNSKLGGMIDNAVVHIKTAKITKAEQATDAHLAHRKAGLVNYRSSATGRFVTAKTAKKVTPQPA